ncbi:MAG: cohesin domain-containing protein [Saprospiraceae bacterium]
MDECGNISTCATTVTVVDDLRPIAACDDLVLVSIPTSGYALVPASTFNEGSSDNCGPVFIKAKRNIGNACDGANGDDSSQQPGYQEWFDDRVIFCCSDIPQNPISVTLRVYEVNPGTGPVNPARETGNGDLAGHFTDCQSVVSLQDAVAPVFSYCPQPVTIQCQDDRENLSLYGSPVIQDNCGYTLDSTTVVTLNECQRGNIVRTWTAADIYGNTSSCSQTITVANNVVLQESHIDWPDNIDLHECGASAAIEDLPLASQGPVINFDGCGTVAINMTEATFNSVPGVCFKVLRTWTVIDWCHFDGETLTGPGRYTFTQIIKVIDDEDPVITCPPPVSVNVGPDCQTAQVTLGLPTAEDCSSQITFTNDSPYATSSGANASGNYPVGTTTVRFYANDGCTNNAACTTTVTVADTKAPTIACIVGLTVNVMLMPDGSVSGMLPATSFVTSASDNCDPASLIKYNIGRPGETIGVPTATTMEFDCEDVATGAVEVEIWASDSHNNSASCTTIVMVQDPNQFCEDVDVTNQSGMIAGGVLTEEGHEVENVMVLVSETQNMMYTEVDGSFVFEQLPLGNDYSLLAQNNEDILNGVTTMDLIFIGKHILGSRLLDSPYKMIAADVDRSGHISTLDIIKLRKLILNIENQMPNGNTSWRFIDASYEFPDPTNPFLTYFPEVYSISDLEGMEMHADFIGVKVGDVNGTAIANSLLREENGSRSGYAMEVKVSEQEAAVGETIDIPFKASYMNEWMGYQFTLEFAPEAMELLEIIPGNIPNLYIEENFHLYDSRSGLITTVWNEYGESAPGGDATLFTIRAKARKAGNVKDWFYISSRVTKAEAYTQEGDPQVINLSFVQAASEATTNFELFQNRPNPWTNSTIIPFNLDPGGDASLSVYDMAGKLVYRVAGNYSEGYHEINISRNDLPSVGLFYYTLECGAQRATRKMVLAD